MSFGLRRSGLSVYLVAAEESGDALGAALARALRQREGGALQLAGVGGRAMASAGIASPFPIDELSIFGVVAIPRRLPAILRHIRETADSIVAARPDALVIIDSPDFTHRVARRVRRRAPDIPILDYVSPSVWAWRPWRARAMRVYVDCVLAILPFEPAAQLRLGGPPCVYVGHPLIERTRELRPSAEEAKRRLGDPPIVLLLPGSRRSEIRRLLGIFGAAAEHVAAGKRIEFVLPTLPHLESQVSEVIQGWRIAPRIISRSEEKWAAFRTARAALAASGTVTLELAVAGVPTVAAYQLPLLEEIILRTVLAAQRMFVAEPALGDSLRTVILANLVMGERVIPEFLQRDCTAANLAQALAPLLADSPDRQRQVAAFRQLDAIMDIGAAAPSSQAAAVVLDVARRGRRDFPAIQTPPSSP